MTHVSHSNGQVVHTEETDVAQLTGFEIAKQDSDYLLHLNIKDGQTVEIVASYEQLDLIAEAIDQQLDRDEQDALSVDSGADAQS